MDVVAKIMADPQALVALAGLLLLLALSIGAILPGPKAKRATGPPFLTKERVSVPLVDKQELSPDTFRFRFGLARPTQRLGLPIGQHVTLFAPNVEGVVKGQWNGRHDVEADEAEIERKYTPTTSDDELGYFDLVIKVYAGGVKEQFPDGGKMSQFLHSLVVGKDSVEIKGPFGRVEYRGRGQFELAKKPLPLKKQVGMLAGGTGITPILQVLNAVLKDPSDETHLSLIYANQTEDDILCRPALEELAEQHPRRFKLHYTLDRPQGDWNYDTGFITADMIKKHLPPPGEETLVLMCGPPPMVKFACEANLEKLGFEKNAMLQF